MNEKFIAQLREEQKCLLPNGYNLIISRGFGKTGIITSKLLTWCGYEIYCQRVEHLDVEETLESAHKWISDYVVRWHSEESEE